MDILRFFRKKEEPVTGFEVYKNYIAVRNHFLQADYDYVTYGGVVNAKETTFQKRKDRWHFEKIAHSYPDGYTTLFVANMLDGSDFWPAGWNSEKCKKNYADFVTRRDNRYEDFASLLESMIRECHGDMTVFRNFWWETNNSIYPEAFSRYLSGDIHSIQIHMMNLIMPVMKRWNELLPEDTVWKSRGRPLRKFCSVANVVCPVDAQKLEETFRETRRKIMVSS